MRIVFLINNMNFSGGRKVFLEYAVALSSKGHDVKVFTLRNEGVLKYVVAAIEVPSFSPSNIPESDLIIATTPGDVKAGFESRRAPRVIHFCQGFEIDDLMQRVEGKVLPLRYQGKGLVSAIKVFMKKFAWKRKIREYDKIYSLGTELITISPHLKKVLEKRYNKKVTYCGNGVKQEFFHSMPNWSPHEFSAERPCRIVSVGPIGVTFKGIPDTIEAIRIVKGWKLPVHFIRISPDPAKEGDLDGMVVDEYHKSLSSKDLGEMLRTCDIYISNSLEGEGFGLPAMEALATGLLCILSSISSYVNFSSRKDFAVFVRERNPQETADAIRKLMALTEFEIRKFRDSSIEVASEYSFEKACDRFEEALRKCGSF